MNELFAAIWGDFVYRTFAVVIGGELLIFGFFMGWLLMQLSAQGKRKEARRAFEKAFSEDFRAAEATEEDVERWVGKAASYPEEVVQEHLLLELRDAEEEERPALLALYRGLGFKRKDRRDVVARSLPRRLAALRRLVVTAIDEDREVLLEGDNETHLVRILKARIFVRVGRPEDIVEVFKDIHLKSRLMEDPIYGLLLDMPAEDFEGIFEQWNAFESPRMKRILLNVAADLQVEAVVERLEEAAEAEDMELRIGACQPAAEYEDGRTLEILMGLLEDETWQVRARAAAALGERADERALEALSGAMKDREFWVRQNAAGALSAFGEPGREVLKEIAEESDDSFARDTASQELGRLEIDGPADGSAEGRLGA